MNRQLYVLLGFKRIAFNIILLIRHLDLHSYNPILPMNLNASYSSLGYGRSLLVDGIFHSSLNFSLKLFVGEDDYNVLDLEIAPEEAMIKMTSDHDVREPVISK